MTYEELHGKVLEAFAQQNWNESFDDMPETARVAIDAVIRCLAREAGGTQIRVTGDGWETWLDNWLLDHLTPNVQSTQARDKLRW